MKGLLARALIRLVALLPFGLAQRAGAAIGWLHWRLPNRSREHARANIETCYAQRAPAWRRRLLRSSLVSMGQTFAESAWLWHHSQARALELVRAVHGRHHLDEARRADRGIVFATPHIGNWELSGAWLAAATPLTVLYRPPRMAALDAVIRRGRERLGGRPVPTDGSGIRALHRALRGGGAIGLLPDQQPRGGQGVEALFMGHPAPTMTLLSRLAARSAASVLFVAMIRRGDGTGFTIHVWPADRAIVDADAGVAARCINRETERAIALAPAQYMWNYRRFRPRRPRRHAAGA